jgi:putative YphP/YqiW family bacilliredoxin
MYPEEMVRPMREELTRVGFREMKTAEEVDQVLGAARGTTLVVVNSICGCAAGKARPGVILALRNAARPELLTTVFAGQDAEATARARGYFSEYRPSSPSVALLRDGKTVFMLERHQIEGRMPEQIAAELTKAFDNFCTPAGTAAHGNLLDQTD